MNKRTVEILQAILDCDSLKIADLSKAFGVSNRTIKNDISSINHFLADNGCSEIVTDAVSGNISYSGDSEHALQVLLDEGANFYVYKLDKDERREFISLMLLRGDEYITISSIAEELLISRQTLINDLDEVKRYFEGFGLCVQSNSNKGLKVAGNENQRRSMLLAIIFSSMTNEGGHIKSYNPYTGLVLSRVFCNEPREIYEKVIKAAENKFHAHLSDSSYTRTVYYCMLAVNRMRKGYYWIAEKPPHEPKMDMAGDILTYLCDYYHLKYTKDEAAALSDFLANQCYTKHDSANSSNTLKVQMIATRFISAVSDELDINLNGDFAFYENLVSHIETTYIREFDESDMNPVRDILMQDYPDIYRVAQKHIHIFNEYMGRDMNEHELSYVVMHICAAIERKRNMESRAKVMVICGSRLATSQLLVEKLKLQFNFDIIDVTSVHKLNENMLSIADLIITTVPLRDFDRDHVVITPMLNDSDFLRIHTKLKSLQFRNRFNDYGRPKPPKSLMNDFRPIVEKYLGEESSEQLMAELNEAASAYLPPQQSKGAGAYLHQLLTEDKILLDVECNDFHSAIRLGGEILLQAGDIKPEYIDAMVNNAIVNGPYFIIAKGFAMPHAPTEEGALGIGMSLMRLREPIDFDEEKGGDIGYICCLSAVDAKGHTKALFNLINLLDNSEFREALKHAGSPQEMAQDIKRFEEEICGVNLY